MSSQGPSQGGDRKLSQSVAGDLVRPRYSPGLILEDGDLTAAVDYSRDLSRLLLRSLFGCGVVSGLKVGVAPGPDLAVTVAPGVALNGGGDPIQLVSPLTIDLGRASALAERGSDQPGPPQYWVVLSGGEKRCAFRDLVCDTDEIDSPAQPTRIRATAEASVLFKRPVCVCGREPPEAGKAAPDRRVADDDCDSYVLLARVEWSEKEKAWGAIHAGVRHFLRPALVSDPLEAEPPARVDKPAEAK